MSIAARRTAEPKVDDKFRAKEEAFARAPKILNSSHRVILGDAREMRMLSQPESIHLVVTSPPYWTLKEYDGAAGEKQLGHVEDYEEFQEQLARVWHRCYELLVPGGRLCVVVGDVCLPRRKEGRHFVVPLHADIAVHCRKIGFDYLTPILWYKIANATTEVEGGAPFLGKPYEPNAIIKNDIEYILMFRKPGGYRTPTTEQRLLSLIEKEEHGRWFRAMWTDVAGSSRERGHPAPFPVEVPYRLIRMFSFVGDLVLDPFLGTGTTTEASMKAYRSSVGYEVEEAYLSMIAERFAQARMNSRIELLSRDAVR